MEEQYLNTLRCQLEDFAGPLSGLEARHVLHESPRHQSGIAAYAQLQDADLIVLATNGRRNPDDDLLGSTAERLIKELPCSVLVVKPPALANVAER
jgi:nucleotide-binding universal stress UspA family protein